MTDPSRRRELLDQLAAFLLDHGLEAATLRRMAAAAGTSDRMLLYYFPDREALLTAVLEQAAARLAAALDAELPAEPLPYPELLRRLRAGLTSPALSKPMQLWLEIASRAGRGERPYARIGEAIGRNFVAWAEARLTVKDDAARTGQAALLLATLDGLALFDSVGLHEFADAAIPAAKPRPLS